MACIAVLVVELAMAFCAWPFWDENPPRGAFKNVVFISSVMYR